MDTKYRPKVPPEIKRNLVSEAGGKCANPACSLQLVEFHHMREWHVYATHDEAHMIAICASCHDAVHRGVLRITEEDLYRWKKIDRTATPHWAALNVEPSSNRVQLLLGPVAIQTKLERLALVHLSKTSQLALRILDGDILQVDSTFHSTDGEELIRITQSQVKVKRDADIEFVHPHAGRVVITVPATPRYVPAWLNWQLVHMEPTFVKDGRVTALEAEVLQPGVIRITGFWLAQYTAMVATYERLHFAGYSQWLPITLSVQGQGAEPILGTDKPLEEGRGFFPTQTLASGFSNNEGPLRHVVEATFDPSSNVYKFVFRDFSKVWLEFRTKPSIRIYDPKISNALGIPYETFASRFEKTFRACRKTPTGWEVIFADDSKMGCMVSGNAESP